jgi:hypothetical protein
MLSLEAARTWKNRLHQPNSHRASAKLSWSITGNPSEPTFPLCKYSIYAKQGGCTAFRWQRRYIYMYNIPVSALQHVRSFSEPFASAWTYYDRGVGSFVFIGFGGGSRPALQYINKYLPLQMSNQDITVSYGHRTVKTYLSTVSRG